MYKAKPRVLSVRSETSENVGGGEERVKGKKALKLIKGRMTNKKDSKKEQLAPYTKRKF